MTYAIKFSGQRYGGYIAPPRHDTYVAVELLPGVQARITCVADVVAGCGADVLVPHAGYLRALAVATLVGMYAEVRTDGFGTRSLLHRYKRFHGAPVRAEVIVRVIGGDS